MGHTKNPSAGPLLIAPTGPLIVPAAAHNGSAPLLSLIIPTLNEAENIVEFLDRVWAVLNAHIPGRYELIVVDDDSPDQTWDVAARAATWLGNVRVIRRQCEGGLATAVVRGWQVASGEVLGTINADFQHPPAVLAQMVELMNDADLVVASRHVDGGGLGDWQIGRRIASWGARLVGCAFVPKVFRRVSDPLSGCYLVRRDAIEGVKLNPLGYKTLIEILVRGRVQRIRECGYEIRKRCRGTSKVGIAQHIQYIRHLIRLRRALDQMSGVREC